MARSKAYQKLLNSPRWKMLRAWKLESVEGHCERCAAQGYVREAVDVHHILPVEGARNKKEMEQRCFSVSNLQALCVPCHIEVHKEMESHTREAHKKRSEDRLRRWVEVRERGRRIEEELRRHSTDGADGRDGRTAAHKR